MKKHRFVLYFIFGALLAVIVASCAPGPTPVPEPTSVPPTATTIAPSPTPTFTPVPPTPIPPTVTPPPTAPQVLQTDPARGEELAPDKPILVHFDRPVDPASVEMRFEPELDGEMIVKGGQVQFIPASYKPGLRYAMHLVAEANGYQTEPLKFDIVTQGFLEVTNTTPGDGGQNVLTDAPVTVAFNRPIVPLGVPSDDPSPTPTTYFRPTRSGSGNWLNTSLYQFQPSPPLLAGTSYMTTVADVSDLGGSALAQSYTFSFTTTLPAVTKIEPEGKQIAPSTPITITFSQPMDRGSTGAAFLVTAEGGFGITGGISWLDGDRTLVMQPDRALPIGQTIRVEVSDTALSSGGQGGLRKAWSDSFVVAPLPRLLRTEPKDDSGNVPLENSVKLIFNTLIRPETVDISINPPISATQVYTWYDPDQNIYFLNFPLLPVTDYTLDIAPGIADPYGNVIAESSEINFRTGERRPSLEIVKFGDMGTFNAYDQPEMLFRHTNIEQINAELYRLTPEQFLTAQPEQNWDRWHSYNPPADQLVRSWSIQTEGERNVTNFTTDALLDETGAAISPGFYFMKAQSPQVKYGQYETRPRMLLVVSPYNVIVKRGHDEGLVWVTDLSNGHPVPDVPVIIQTFDNAPISGSTGADGLFQTDITASKEPWRVTVALAGTDDLPGWGSTANSSVSPWELGISTEYSTQRYRIHLYTDRPLYRAGDTIYFRAVIREDSDANYTPVEGLTATVNLNDYQGQFNFKQEYTTDAFGSVHGEIALPEDAPLGGYSMDVRLSEQDSAYANFLVAAFRTPEFQVQADVEPAEVIANQPATATGEASYFFGGPVKNAKVRWTVFGGPYTFTYEDDQNWSFSDIEPGYDPWPWFGGFGGIDPCWSPVYAEGEGVTDEQGRVRVSVPTEIIAEGDNQPTSQQRLIEFSVTDASDQEITGSSEYVVHNAGLYPGVRPDQYVGQAGQEQIAHFILVNATTNEPAPGLELAVEISQIAWRTTRVVDEYGRLDFQTTIDEELILSTVIATGADGEAEIVWLPPASGQYLIRGIATDEFGSSNRSAAFSYIAGDEFAVWPQQPDDSIDLIADRDEYQVGDTAHVLSLILQRLNDRPCRH